MSIPGFTAEATLSRRQESYLSTAFEALSTLEIIPASLGGCCSACDTVANLCYDCKAGPFRNSAMCMEICGWASGCLGRCIPC